MRTIDTTPIRTGKTVGSYNNTIWNPMSLCIYSLQAMATRISYEQNFSDVEGFAGAHVSMW